MNDNVNLIKSDHNPSRKFGWFLLVLGTVLIPADFVAALLASWPEWRWERTFFGHYLFWPLIILAFLCCSIAAFFTSFHLRRRLLFSLLGCLLAALTFVLSKVAMVLLYGV